MQAVDVALVADRLSVLSETESIGADLTVFEQRFGYHEDVADLRQRGQRVRLMILTQSLVALLALQDVETVH